MKFDCILELDGNAIFLEKQISVFGDGCPNQVEAGKKLKSEGFILETAC